MRMIRDVVETGAKNDAAIIVASACNREFLAIGTVHDGRLPFVVPTQSNSGPRQVSRGRVVRADNSAAIVGNCACRHSEERKGGLRQHLLSTTDRPNPRVNRSILVVGPAADNVFEIVRYSVVK